MDMDKTPDRLNREHQEETAMEFAAPYPLVEEQRSHALRLRKMKTNARLIALVSLLFSLLSLLFAHFILGTAGILIGFAALRKGEITAGSWGIGIGAFSLIIGVLM